ncbi:hypothetical protein BaRGS_00004591 [Batillaria attramentaria]|uniref:Uncharacterized protein n=1 Tax=Batillaria attramentaria TaxID=370345 RepID=A0ABD0LXR7_9CAEN
MTPSPANTAFTKACAHALLYRGVHACALHFSFLDLPMFLSCESSVKTLLFPLFPAYQFHNLTASANERGPLVSSILGRCSVIVWRRRSRASRTHAPWRACDMLTWTSGGARRQPRCINTELAVSHVCKLPKIASASPAATAATVPR